MDTNSTPCLLHNSSTNQYVCQGLSEEEIKKIQGQVNIEIHKIGHIRSIQCRSLRGSTERNSFNQYNGKPRYVHQEDQPNNDRCGDSVSPAVGHVLCSETLPAPVLLLQLDNIFKMDTNSDICTVCKRSNNQTEVEALSQEDIKERLTQARTVMLILQSRLTIHHRFLEGEQEQKYKAVLEVLWNACEDLQIRTGALKPHLTQIKHTCGEEISIFKLTEHITNTSCQLSIVSEELLRLCYYTISKKGKLINYIIKQDDFNELKKDVIRTMLKFESFSKNHTELRMNEEIERQTKMGRTIFCPLTV